MALTVRLQRHTKIFKRIKAYGQKIFKTYLNIIYIALNVRKLMCVIQIYRSMFPEKNGINSANILFTGSHKSFLKLSSAAYEGMIFSNILLRFSALWDVHKVQRQLTGLPLEEWHAFISIARNY